MPPGPPGPPGPGPGPLAAPAPPPPGPAAAPAGHRACSKCGFSNPPGFAFCGSCGQKLESAAPAGGEDVGSAQTVFVDQAPEELARLRDQASALNLGDPSQPVVDLPLDRPPPVVAPEPEAGKPTAPPTGPGLAGLAGAPPAGPSGAPATTGARLIMLGPDGSPIGERVLAAGETLAIGRSAGPPWDEDAYLDDDHGALTPLDEGIRAEDHGSLNGIYFKLTQRVEIQNRDQFRVGQELLLYEDLPEPTPTADGTERMGSPNPGYWGRLSLLVEPDVASQAYAIEGEGLMIGRESGDITFPLDGYVSGSHCRIVGDDTGVFIEDLGSSNGTYMRVRSGAVLPYGTLVLIGQKLFQLERA